LLSLARTSRADYVLHKMTDKPVNIVPHILCGGSGTRLWPLSREAFPKQFVPLVDGRSLLACTLERAALLGGSLVCIANVEHRFLVDAAAREANVAVEQILEPIARNTAAAMAGAALLAAPEDLLLFLPADHYIPDAEGFARTIREGIPAAMAGYIVTFGIVPGFPSSAYGYIQQGARLADYAGYAVERFIEKPAPEAAEQLLLAGSHLWNAGIFLVRANVLLDALRRHAPDILDACTRATAASTTLFGHRLLDAAAIESCTGISIDYAVMEHHDRVAVMPFNGVWSDVGSWSAVAQLHPGDADGNRLSGQAYAVNCKDVFISAPHRPVVALHMKDTIIVDTPDAVLVADAAHAEQVRDVVARLKSQGLPQITQHRCVSRPWGSFDCVDAGECFQVKRLIVNPGAALSLQMHHHRAEHWIIVKGTAKVTLGGETFILSENQSTYIPLGTKHRLENPGKTPLEMIEVQSGAYLGEDDIVRFEDQYGRNI
jgi:mannose-1-phosphate guanylyltransferase/mannose-6-phosphate isomerase